MEDKELLKRIKELKKLKQKKKELQELMKSVEDEIKDAMEERDIEELYLSTYTVRYQSITTNRFDTTAFKLTHKDLYNQYTKPSTSKRLTIV